MFQKTCARCGKVYEVTKEEFKRGFRCYCSNSCKHTDLRLYYIGADGTKKFTYKSTRLAQKNR